MKVKHSVRHLLNLMVCLIFMAAAAVGTYGKLLGYDFRNRIQNKAFSLDIDWSSLANPKFIVALVVLIAASILPFWVHSRRYRILQEILNVLIVGLWSGTFLSYSLMLGILSNGFTLGTSLLIVIMLIAAFVYPFFGKKSHYCMWMCPMGSAQELMSRINFPWKIKLNLKTLHVLEIFRDLLWAVLMLILCLGIGFSWTNYEVFIAFLLSVAPLGVLLAAVVVLTVSLFIPRPYCRFICPTGNLFRLAQEK